MSTVLAKKTRDASRGATKLPMAWTTGARFRRYSGSGSETCMTYAGPFEQDAVCGLDHLDTKDFLGRNFLLYGI